jgi:aryl-alcohol dehydrogenase-like predicted oxidoreductase
MFATAAGTTRYINRHPEFRDAGFYRPVFDLKFSTLGLGTYLDASPEAICAAAEGGINFFDTAINYRNQQSERDIGAALEQLQRDEIVLSSKAGFLTPDAVPKFLKPEDVVGGMHSMAPAFLADQVDRSRANLRVDTVDIYYLHNPETQLGFVTRDEFDARMARAFAQMEELVERKKIRWYGCATWEGLRKKDAMSLPRLVELAQSAGGPEHHFRFVQLPFNLAMVEAYLEGGKSLLAEAARLGIAVVASATLMQAQILNHMPDSVQQVLPGLATDAQRAIQFTRSTPGIAVALVGMARREHVLENLGVALVPPVALQEYLRLYR